MIVSFTDYTLGLNQSLFDSLEHKANYNFISVKGNILSGGNKQTALTFLEKVSNYMMKQGRNTGKKEMCYNQLTEVLTEIEKSTGLNPILVFTKAIFNGMPLRSIRREKKGSGKITRAVYLSPSKKLIFSLSTLTKELASKRKRNKSYVSSFVKEIILAYNKDSTSILISKRRESEAYADSSNY